MNPLPIGPLFFGENWQDIEPALGNWYLQVSERTQLRTKLKTVCPSPFKTGKSEFENWSISDLTELLTDARNLVTLTRSASDACRALCVWLQLPKPSQSREELAGLVELSDKHEVLVFSGLRADQIDLTRTRARGVRDLKYFLDYADRGPKALIAATTAHGMEQADSELEKMVADRIRKAGYDVHHQVGCSAYRVDLAVVDPAAPGRYLLGIECDGATYHRAATARDRDKLRQMILAGLGWRLHRIWSTEWWHDAGKEMDKLLEVLGTLHGKSSG